MGLGSSSSSGEEKIQNLGSNQIKIRCKTVVPVQLCILSQGYVEVEIQIKCSVKVQVQVYVQVQRKTQGQAQASLGFHHYKPG